MQRRTLISFTICNKTIYRRRDRLHNGAINGAFHSSHLQGITLWFLWSLIYHEENFTQLFWSPGDPWPASFSTAAFLFSQKKKPFNFIAMENVIEFKGYDELFEELFCVTANAERFFRFLYEKCTYASSFWGHSLLQTWDLIVFIFLAFTPFLSWLFIWPVGVLFHWANGILHSLAPVCHII